MPRRYLLYTVPQRNDTSDYCFFVYVYVLIYLLPYVFRFLVTDTGDMLKRSNVIVVVVGSVSQNSHVAHLNLF